jgi:hypothetical protein
MFPYHKQHRSNTKVQRNAGSCFWCASFLELPFTIDVCPSCMNGKVESMPLSDKEIYAFDFDPTS